MINDDQCVRLSAEFSLLVHNGKHMSRHVDEAVGMPGFSLPLLSFLDAHGEQRLRPLAEAHHLDPSVISRYVAALEERGLVARRPDPDDGRASLIGMTDAGREALALCRAARQTLITSMTVDWTTDEVDALIDMLRRINASTLATMDELVGGGAAARRVRRATGIDPSSADTRTNSPTKSPTNTVTRTHHAKDRVTA